MRRARRSPRRGRRPIWVRASAVGGRGGGEAPAAEPGRAACVGARGLARSAWPNSIERAGRLQTGGRARPCGWPGKAAGSKLSWSGLGGVLGRAERDSRDDFGFECARVSPGPGAGIRSSGLRNGDRQQGPPRASKDPRPRVRSGGHDGSQEPEPSAAAGSGGRRGAGPRRASP
ncbi:MAG: hypothetical protein J3K34DRAFT_402467 [Monoraphidium minutum]|nr:MAG: hypothetical protein J3K34DRAFT_402467 [Monoraphidium minutum]